MLSQVIKSAYKTGEIELLGEAILIPCDMFIFSHVLFGGILSLQPPCDEGAITMFGQ